MLLRYLLFCTVLVGFFVETTIAQSLRLVESTPTHKTYEFKNDSLRFRPALAFTIESSSNIEFLEQRWVPINAADYGVSTSLFGKRQVEQRGNGWQRRVRVKSVNVNVMINGREDDRALVYARIRVPKINQSNVRRKSTIVLTKAIEDSPFSQGVWYKIPINKAGFFQLDTQYLTELGLDPDNLDPRNIQIWGTSGHELPEPNDSPRPTLRQFPIQVLGEEDGRFNADDRVVFYQGGVNRVFYNETLGRFEHAIHKYSELGYVFLTVGDIPGRRISTLSATGATPTLSSFERFSWKEEELFKAEADIKSGRQWLGQEFTTSIQQGAQVIFTDTLVGLLGSEVKIEVLLAGRALNISSNFDLFANGSSLATIAVFPISTFDGETGLAARERLFSGSVSTSNLGGQVLELSAEYRHRTASATGWIDFVRAWYQSSFTAKNNQLLAHLKPQSQTFSRAVLDGFSSQPFVWDVSDVQNAVALPIMPNGNGFEIFFRSSIPTTIHAQIDPFTPELGQRIANQNLTGIATFPEYIIVTSEVLLEQAQRLATYRRGRSGVEAVVVTQNQIFNEFSGGVADFVAIRDFVKHLWDVTPSPERLPKHLLLFGNTHYDYKGIEAKGSTTAFQTNHVFTYQTNQSFERLSSFGSDDFFGLLDDDEGAWEIFGRNDSDLVDRVDIGVGRIPAETVSDAAVVVDKIIEYENPANFGDWRSVVTFLSDDDVSGNSNDRDLHLINADVVADQISNDSTSIRLNKIYLLSFTPETTPVGRRFPEATRQVIESVNRGTLILNYSGHGDEQVLADERVFQSELIPEFTNKGKYPIFITATCQFGRFDDTIEQSGAEKAMFFPNAGMIGSFTTTRVVFTSRNLGDNNFGLNLNLNQYLIERDDEGLPPRLGDIYRETKNTSPGFVENGRKFILLGDPYMRLGLPQRDIRIEQINGNDLDSDTLKLQALETVALNGSVRSANEQIDADFNGQVTVTLFDGRRVVNYPEKDWTAQVCNQFNPCRYFVQNDILFKGQVTVRNGRFQTNFIIPKDIAFSELSGRVHLYAQDAAQDASGSFSRLLIQGINPQAGNDTRGPELQVYLNDEVFTDGMLVNAQPILRAELSDNSGINTAGTGVGHELLATINTSPETVLILNDFYTSDLDDFRKGSLETTLPELEAGDYTMSLRAWDVFNNLSEQQIRFSVAQTSDLVIRNVFNYPNPMTERTRFVFEHNQSSGTPISVRIRVFTLSGRPVTQLESEEITSGNLLSLDWNGRDMDGDRIANGTYLYHVRVVSEGLEGRSSAEKIEKLVIIR